MHMDFFYLHYSKQVCKHHLAPHLQQVPMDRTLLDPPEVADRPTPPSPMPPPCTPDNTSQSSGPAEKAPSTPKSEGKSTKKKRKQSHENLFSSLTRWRFSKRNSAHLYVCQWSHTRRRRARSTFRYRVLSGALLDGLGPTRITTIGLPGFAEVLPVRSVGSTWEH